MAVFNKSIRNLNHRVVLSEDKIGDLCSRSGAAASATALHMSGCAHTEREHGVLELLLQGFDGVTLLSQIKSFRTLGDRGHDLRQLRRLAIIALLGPEGNLDVESFASVDRVVRTWANLGTGRLDFADFAFLAASIRARGRGGLHSPDISFEQIDGRALGLDAAIQWVKVIRIIIADCCQVDSSAATTSNIADINIK